MQAKKVDNFTRPSALFTNMSRAFFLLFIVLFLCACDLDGPFNPIPCRYSLEKLYDTLKVYSLRSSGAAPKGFKSKEVYNVDDLDTSSWDIFLAIDSPNNLFFSESFVAMLARNIFDDSSNGYFQHISFRLQQVISPIVPGSPGTAELTYFIDRDTDTGSFTRIPTSANAQIARKINESYVSAGEHGNWRTVALEIDSIPVDAYQLAKQYRQTHKQFQDIEIFVKQVPSGICKSVKYQFWFGDSTQLRTPNP